MVYRADEWPDAYWETPEAKKRAMEFQRQKEMLEDERKLPVYKQIARDALMSWNGLSEEEATKTVRELSNEELEKQVYAEGSIDYALEGFKLFAKEHLEEKFGSDYKSLIVSDEQIGELKEAIMNGPINASIFTSIETGLGLHTNGDTARADEIVANAKQNGEKIDWEEVYKVGHKTKNDFIISILSHIHDGWVKDNQRKFMARDKKYQHMPIELIGWKEAKSDLLFLKPILSAMHIDCIEDMLEEAYNERVKAFLKEKGISNVNELTEQISRGAEFYPALEGQKDIIEALQDTKFVEEQVVSGIKDKGIGTNELIFQQLFGGKVIEGADELEALRAQKQALVKQATTISEAEKLVEAKENQGQNLD